MFVKGKRELHHFIHLQSVSQVRISQVEIELNELICLHINPKIINQVFCHCYTTCVQYTTVNEQQYISDKNNKMLLKRIRIREEKVKTDTI